MESQELNEGRSEASQQLLTFSIGDECYGVDILRVKEIRGWSRVTRLPQSLPHVLGVLNLRGAIVPIVDLRMRFALQSAEYTPKTVIIVLSLPLAGAMRECGVVVDGVSDVVDIPNGAIKSPPLPSDGTSSDCIMGIATIDGKMLIVLDVDALIVSDLQPAAVVKAA